MRPRPPADITITPRLALGEWSGKRHLRHAKRRWQHHDQCWSKRRDHWHRLGLEFRRLQFGSGATPSVSTTSGDFIDSGSAGILAADEATRIAASADSSVAVTAAGTIHLGPSRRPTASPDPAGHNSNHEPEPNVAGNVTVTADANITAAAGDGIRAFNFGSGNVTVNDDGGTIHTLGDPISGKQVPLRVGRQLGP